MFRIKLYLKGWRKTEMPNWVSNKFEHIRTKTVPYGKTYFFKGNRYIYRVYNTIPTFQGNSGEQITYKKRKRK